MQNKKKNIVNRAVNRLEKETGFNTTLHFYDQRDAVLIINNENYHIEFNIEVKLFVNRTRLGMIINQLKGIRGNPLLITTYVNPELMETMEENGINFIDAAGNALIKVAPLFIKLKGNKLNENEKTVTTKKIFNTAALQVIFTLLCNPGIENRTIRVIEENTGVAIGTVYNTIQELIEQGYMLRRNFQRYRLINKRDLLERWVTLYPERLKPKYVIGRYEMNERTNEIEIEDYDALWGGEEAAARITNYLQPYLYTIYIGNKQGEFILKNRLKKNPQGNLILMNKFWKFENNYYPGLTHPILVYADLLATGDPRNIETAKIIYEKDIVRYIQEDR